MQFNVGDKIKDRRTGLLGEVIGIRVSFDTYPLNVRVPENVLRKNSDGYDCPETYWCAPHELVQLTPQTWEPAKPKTTEYGYDPINGWPDAAMMERYVADLQRWFNSPNEADFERMERTQEQAARLRDAADQNADAEEPFGEHWQKLMRQHSKTELIAALKVALEREAKLKLYLKNQ